MPRNLKKRSDSPQNTVGESSNVFYENGKKYNFRAKGGTPYFRVTYTVNGKQRSVYGDGEKDARKKVEAAKARAASGLDLDRDKVKTGVAFHDWLFNVKRVDKDLKASSFARYEATFRNHIEPYPIARGTLSKLSSATMQAYVTEMYTKHGASTATIKNAIKVWRMFLAWALEEGLIIKNPCRNISLPGKREKGQKRKVEIFTAEERKVLMTYMRETRYEYDTLVKLAFATGMRLGELLGLSWRDIGKDFINVERSTAVVTHVDEDGNRERYREIWDPKTESSNRIVQILPETAAMLAEHRAAQVKFFAKRDMPLPWYVFTTKTGKLIDSTSFAKSWRRLLNRAGIEYKNFHCIRHTFATEALRSGVPISDVKELLGHSDLATTMRYVSHSNEEAKRNAIERMGSLVL